MIMMIQGLIYNEIESAASSPRASSPRGRLGID